MNKYKIVKSTPLSPYVCVTLMSLLAYMFSKNNLSNPSPLAQAP